MQNKEVKSNLMKMNLQKFAEDADSNVNADVKPEEQKTENEGADNKDENQPTVEQLMAEMAKLNAEKAKLKNSLDEAASEAAKFKKALREKQSAEEIRTEEEQKAQEEHNKYVAGLEAFKKQAEAKARYALQGMNEELATKAAEAEVKGDYDLLASVQRQYAQELIKAKEKEWLKNRPDISAGNGEDGAEKDPFLMGWEKGAIG